jgi:hypothetical protein
MPSVLARRSAPALSTGCTCCTKSCAESVAGAGEAFATDSSCRLCSTWLVICSMIRSSVCSSIGFIMLPSG